MKTILYKIEDSDDDNHAVELASELLKAGDVVAIPTETVYGLAADGLNEKACEKIFRVKGRPSDNPIILHISTLDQLDELVLEVNERAKKLIDKFWPGPLTIIFNKSDIVPDIVTAKGTTVAIRMPSNVIARRVIEKTGRPLAAPSANLSGLPSPTNAEDVLKDFDGKIPFIIDGGECIIGIESTVIDVTREIPMILRPGLFTLEEIKKVLPETQIDSGVLTDKEAVKSPGQKYKHYAPEADLFVYMGNVENRIEEINKMVAKKTKNGKKVAVLCFRENLDKIKGAFSVLDLGSIEDPLEMAKLIFKRLRDCDDLGVDEILCEGVEEQGLGIALMNRLRKASGGKVKNIK